MTKSGSVKASAKRVVTAVKVFCFVNCPLVLRIHTLVCAATEGNSFPGRKKVAVFAGGLTVAFSPRVRQRHGVHQTVVGYCGGTEPNPPRSRDDGKDDTGNPIRNRTRPLEIPAPSCWTFTGKKSIRHKATGEFTDIRPSYRAAIFVANDGERKKSPRNRRRNWQRKSNSTKPIVTEITSAMKFTSGELSSSIFYRTNPDHFEAFENGSRPQIFFHEKWGDKP